MSPGLQGDLGLLMTGIRDPRHEAEMFFLHFYPLYLSPLLGETNLPAVTELGPIETKLTLLGDAWIWFEPAPAPRLLGRPSLATFPCESWQAFLWTRVPSSFGPRGFLFVAARHSSSKHPRKWKPPIRRIRFLGGDRVTSASLPISPQPSPWQGELISSVSQAWEGSVR